MELLYLWIENFRNIQKQGFDFSPEFKFQIEELSKGKENNSLEYKLIISANEGYVNLFEHNIINTTGIVGKNGSGKSTLLHCLKMMTGKLPALLCPLIFCLRDIKSESIETYYYNGGGDKSMIPLKVTVKADKNIKKSIKILPSKAYTIDRFGINGSKVNGLDFDFNSIASCYFSNTFDSHKENIYEGIHNISTNYKLDNFLKDYIASKEKAAQSKKREVSNIDLWPSHISQFHKIELKGLVKFLSYANTRKTNTLPNLPESLIIEFKFDDYEFLTREENYSLLYKKNEIESIQKTAIQLLNKSKNKRSNFLNMVIITSFYHLLKKASSQDGIISTDELGMLIKSLSDTQNNFFESVRNIIILLGKNKDEPVQSQTINELLGKPFENAVNKIKFTDTDEVSDNKVYYRLKIDNNLWGVLKLIFDLQALEEATFLDYTWGGGLSTGQEAFLIHFARLHELKGKVRKKLIWLFIDEGDIYFHPEWQKKYFSELLNYVNFLFPINKVQIIITTHSPFIVSDLPKQNLIFLQQNSKNLCKVINNDVQIETFGSNIHDLFTNSFFLADGLMGEFARVKIAKLIKELNDNDNISQDTFKTKYRNQIEIIGEPFIKAKLFELVARKSDDSVIDSIIDQRNDEIERLKMLKRKK